MLDLFNIPLYPEKHCGNSNISAEKIPEINGKGYSGNTSSKTSKYTGA